ncbi:hypothetical protein GLOTRDRAFT_112240 [Gloeophyllum trabeum ATCC 11539]|uniref:Carbohydrate-binding module family 13 protein n=1 Tax=Gloeophyllum trabeum (strain ATCC 11539 / FP-39264 / Madison 617) TaxID=670483 RepID=S7PXF3_GLOTA|nr:uncharacterized protein GLOTRDRAFT_112240 [Gloeophyllum trabeum ATCC 11539]EPQ52291.1 hypothetical protein GLOTRDRAFT_112240 [Gloeophyllum trabeum ATCC 11539]
MLGLAAFSILLAASASAQTYSATYLPSNAPPQTEQGQAGTNQCGTGVNQTSLCQNAYINSIDDFCIFGPPEPGPQSVIGNTERIEVAYCMKAGYGTRIIPDGTMQGVYFVQTPDYVQVTGVGDLTKINIPAGDAGGELDPHGADGNGNPIGGLVFSSAFGQLAQMHEWTNFVSATEFCFRACKDGPGAPALCQHIYDEMGCMWNMPGNYSPGAFEQCAGDSGEPMGVYGTSTFYQGQPSTPSAHPAPATSSCTSHSTIGNGLAVSGSSIISSASTTSASATSSGARSSVGSTSSSSATGSSASQTVGSRSSSLSQGASGSRTASGGASATNSNSSAARLSAGYGWEQAVMTLGLGVIGSLVGAVMVL